MKRYIVTRCSDEPDSRITPSAFVRGFDTLEEAENLVEQQMGNGNHYQIYEGVVAYVSHIEHRKMPFYTNGG